MIYMICTGTYLLGWDLYDLHDMHMFAGWSGLNDLFRLVGSV